VAVYFGADGGMEYLAQFLSATDGAAISAFALLPFPNRIKEFSTNVLDP
jgi:hypothetical protein